MDKLILNGQALSLREIEGVALAGCHAEVAGEALRRVAESRGLIERILAAGETVYGVNTGFGKLADVRIPGDKLAELQINLVRSHAGGVGQPLAEAEARAMLLLRTNVLAKGFSGVRPELLAIATGAGSLIFSHVNDGGFWLVKEYFNMSVGDTMKTWSISETLISVIGLLLTLGLSVVI